MCLLAMPFKIILSPSVGCGTPVPPTNGNITGNNDTRPGATLTFYCTVGYTPDTPLTSTCNQLGVWTPAPQEHNCTRGMNNIMCILTDRALLLFFIQWRYFVQLVKGLELQVICHFLHLSPVHFQFC
jgi:hypothetical protein